MKKNKYIIIGLLMMFIGIFITFNELIVELYHKHYMFGAFFYVIIGLVIGVLIGSIITRVK